MAEDLETQENPREDFETFSVLAAMACALAAGAFLTLVWSQGPRRYLAVAAFLIAVFAAVNFGLQAIRAIALEAADAMFEEEEEETLSPEAAESVLLTGQ